jgi:hypothetical protein
MGPRKKEEDFDSSYQTINYSGHKEGVGVPSNSKSREKMRKLESAYSSPKRNLSNPSNHSSKSRKPRGTSMDRCEQSDSYLDYGDINGEKAIGRKASKGKMNESFHGPDRNKIRVNRPSVNRQQSKPALTQQKSKPDMTRQKSKPALTQQKSKPDMKRAKSKPDMARQKSKPDMERAKSKPDIARQKSKPDMARQKSKPDMARQKSKPDMARQKSKPDMARQKSKPDMIRQKSKAAMSQQDSAPRGRSSKQLEMDRSRSGSKVGSRSNSRPRPSLGDKRHSTIDLASGAPGKGPPPGRKNQKWRDKFKKVEEKPRKGLIVIWVVVLAELAFDLGTTIIAFQAMMEEGECCGYTLNLGPLPLTVATPFIFLIILELLILVRAVVLTLWPSFLDKSASDTEDESEDGPKRSIISKCLCCCLRWNVKVLLKFINVLVLLNPFFGCVIAWMLLYQSDKTESFIVLGLEAGSIILHFISVKLEDSVVTFRQFLCHCVPLIPFLVSVALVLVYLKQEGVCYIVEKTVFQFNGCEICPDGFPPADGNCTLADGTVVSVGDSSLFDVPSDLDGLTGKTSLQGTFCGDEHEGYSTNVCFFDYA